MPSAKPSKKALEAEQRAKLVAALEGQRAAGSYPLSIGELAAGIDLGAEEATRLLTSKAAQTLVKVAKKGEPRSPIVLAADVALLAASDDLLKFAADEAASFRRASNSALAGKPDKLFLDAKLDKILKPGFVAALAQRTAAGNLPAEVRELIIPPPLPPAEFAGMLVALLKSQPKGVAPLPASELQKLAHGAGLTGDFKRAIGNTAFKSQVIEWTTDAGKAYLLAADLPNAIPRMATLGISRATAKSAGKTTAFKATELAAMLVLAPHRKVFAAAWEDAATAGQLGGDVAWIKIKGVQLYFSAKGVLQSPTPPANSAVSRPTAQTSSPSAAGFRDQFEAAFERVDAREGRYNFVKLFDLRRELSSYSREAFDAGLRELRLAGLFTLDSSEGGAVQLTPEERAAGIREGSSLLIYASRK